MDANLYGGNPKNSSQIFGKIELNSKFVTIDTGTSYAMAPMMDILAITQALRINYDIDCHPDNSQ